MALKIQPDYVMGWQVLAEIYGDMGMLDEKRLADAQANLLVEYHCLAGSDKMSRVDELKTELNWMIQNGHMSTALQLAERIKEESGDDPYAWLDYAMMKMSNGDRKGAMEEIRRLVKTHPDFPHGWHNLSALLVSAGDMVEAEKALRRTIQLEPRDATARMNLGYVFYRTGRTKAAITSLRKSIRMEPTAEACYNLGRILHVLEIDEEARKFLEQALFLNPRFSPAQDELDDMP